MRSEREKQAAATRALFKDCWEKGIRQPKELMLVLKQGLRNTQHLVAQWKSGEMAKKIAADLAKAAIDGEPPPGCAEDPAAAGRGSVDDLPPDPGVEFEHMSVLRRIMVAPAAKHGDKIRAASELENARQYNLEHGIGAGAKNLRLEDWMEMPFDAMPVQARPRWFGFLAQEMAAARTPWLSMPETTPEQVEVWHALGRQVAAEDAVELVVILRAALVLAKTKADELAAARSGPPPEIEPVNPEDYLDHVPGGSRGS